MACVSECLFQFSGFSKFRIYFSNAESDYVVKTATEHARITPTADCMIPNALVAAKQVAAAPS